MFEDLLHFAYTCAFFPYYLIGVSIISLLINLCIFYDDNDYTLDNFMNALGRTILGILGALAAYFSVFILIGLFITYLYVCGIIFLILMLLLFCL